MDERNAFERQIADELGHMAGPGRQIDAVGMTRSVSTTPVDGHWSSLVRRVRGEASGVAVEGRLSMFSALKWVTAAVVVALFGTVVLLGVLPSAQDDMAPGAPRTTEQLLAVSETEEIEPGVLRIIDDGVRNLANVSDGVTVGSDGAVWLHRADGAYFQVGEEPTGDLMSYADRDGWQVDDTWGERSFSADSLHAGPSGQLWVQVEDGVRTWRDGDWVEPAGEPVRPVPPTAMEVEADGTAWVKTSAGLWQQAPDGTTQVERPPVTGRNRAHSWGVSDEGTAYLVREVGMVSDALFRYRDGQWDEIPLPGPIRGAPNTDLMGVGADGTVWVVVQDEEAVEGDGDDDTYGEPAITGLARLDGIEWSTFDLADGGMTWDGSMCFVSPCRVLRVSPDGSAWLNASPSASGGRGDDGIVRFDGATWSHYLPGTHVGDLDFALDGTAWVVAGSHVYVIDPGSPNDEE